MKVSLNKGVLKIDSKEVLAVVFTDGTNLKFPIEDTNEIIVENGNNSTATVFGHGNVVISGKNIVTPGSNISVEGNFRIGDG